jgi:hypothetical protein
MNSILHSLEHLLTHQVLISEIHRSQQTVSFGAMPNRSFDHFALSHQALQKKEYVKALALNLMGWRCTDLVPAFHGDSPLSRNPSYLAQPSQQRLTQEGVVLLGQILWFWRENLPPQINETMNLMWQQTAELFFALGEYFDLTRSPEKSLQSQWRGLGEGLHPNFWKVLGFKSVRLRRMGLGDQLALLSLLKEPNFIEHYLPSLKAEKEYVIQWCKVAQSPRSPMKRIEFSVVDVRNDALIGLASLGNLDNENRSAEFLVGISSHVRDTGLGAVSLQASVLLINWAFDILKLNKLISFVYDQNDQAQKATMKLGFKPVTLLQNQVKNLQTGEKANVFKNGLSKSDFDLNPQLQRWVKRFCIHV